MDSSTSSENIIQQVESLRNELEDCRKTLEISKYNLEQALELQLSLVTQIIGKAY